MNILIKNLIEKSLSDNLDEVMYALTDIGLIIERHTQKRYSQEQYLSLLGNNMELYNYRLDDNEAELLVHFIFYHIINVQQHQVTSAWALGKCYGFDIYKGFLNLFKIFKKNDDVCQQLIFSATALFEKKNMYKEIYSILENSIKNGDLPESTIILNDRIHNT